MIQPSNTSASPAHLERRIGLRSAVLFNMLEMIGVGPFITLPAGDRRRGLSAFGMGVDRGRGDRRGRRPGVGRTGRRLSASRRLLRLSARDLRPRARRQLAQLSLRVAVELFGAAFHRFRLHRALQLSGLVLAGARCERHSRFCPRCTTPASPPPVPACW